MCNYISFANREAYGLDIYQGWTGGPWIFVCKKCKLNPDNSEGNWTTKAKFDWLSPGDKSMEEVKEIDRDLTRMYTELKDHIKAHKDAGHYVHPSIEIIVNLSHIIEHLETVGPLIRKALK